MAIELPEATRRALILSMERYFRDNMEEPHTRIGNIAAGGLLNFFLEEMGPSIYNQAIADAQERMQARVAELDIEVHEEELQYWRKYDESPRKRR